MLQQPKPAPTKKLQEVPAYHAVEREERSYHLSFLQDEATFLQAPATKYLTKSEFLRAPGSLDTYNGFMSLEWRVPLGIACELTEGLYRLFTPSFRPQEGYEFRISADDATEEGLRVASEAWALDGKLQEAGTFTCGVEELSSETVTAYQAFLPGEPEEAAHLYDHYCGAQGFGLLAVVQEEGKAPSCKSLSLPLQEEVRELAAASAEELREAGVLGLQSFTVGKGAYRSFLVPRGY